MDFKEEYAHRENNGCYNDLFKQDYGIFFSNTNCVGEENFPQILVQVLWLVY